MKHQRIVVVLAVALLAAGCKLPTALTKAAGEAIEREGVITRAPVAGVAIRGTLLAPAGLIANNGGGLIGKTKSYHLTALDEHPLAGADVYLATADGRAIPGLAAVKTDADGHFVFPRVPKGFAFVVATPVSLDNGESGQLATLAKASDGGAQAQISLASTLVTAAIVRGQAGTVGDFSPEAFNQALAATAQRLEPSDVAKVADPAAAATRVAEVAKADQTVQSALTTLQQEVAKPAQSLDDLQSQVSAINAQASSAPASPAPSAAAATPPAASKAPSSAPTGATRTYTVSTLAGKAGTSGFANGKGASALFHTPNGLALAADGTIYVADSDNHRIRKVTPDGTVGTFVGSGTAGFTDGKGTAAALNTPWGLALDTDGTLYVADLGNCAIRAIAPDGTVTTVAGNGTAGRTDGTGKAAKFSTGLKGLCVSNGTIYAADSGNHLIRKVSPAGVVTTLAGSTYNFADGKGTAAAFRNPSSVALGPDGTLYVADGNNYAIRAITPDGTVSTVAGKPFESGQVDGTGDAARFNFLQGLAWVGDRLIVCDQTGATVRAVTPAGKVTTLAGIGGTGGSADGPGTSATFRQPHGVAGGPDGVVYVTDSNNHTLRVIK